MVLPVAPRLVVLWITQAYPARRFGLPPTLQAFLIAVERRCRGVGKVGGDFYRQTFGMALLMAPRQRVLWYNAFPGTALISFMC
jgi:hypothetical protein